MAISPSSPAAQNLPPDLAARLAAAQKQTARVVPAAEWRLHEPLIADILRLKREKDAVILAHNYQTPEIFYGVADIVGDSLKLAQEAAKTSAAIIVQAGVKFMAETSKLLSPDKKVLLPDLAAGCSLADSITAADVRLMRERYPGAPVATYVNSNAEVKAESDICITSSNAVQVVKSLNARQVICLPDEYLAHWIQTQLPDIEIITWRGHCEVHERFTAAEIETYRAQTPGLIVLAHPECPPEVLAAADFVGSTAAMGNYVTREKPARVVMITECSMSDNVAAQAPETEFVRPCNLCPHMKRITLPAIKACLENLSPEITVPAALMAPARRAIERMLAASAKTA